MILTCPSCGKKNRSPANRLADVGRCGACRTEISPVGSPIEADPDSFHEITHNARVPVLVDFWAAWCGPCRTAAPEVERTAREMKGQALVVKVDTERWPELAAEYRVQSIPNFAVIHRGRLVSQQAGVVPSATMSEWLRRAATTVS
jgi:thioredoxin 2